MATTMIKDGKPTVIDFNKQCVIALILPGTYLMTCVESVGLQKYQKGKNTQTLG